MRPLLLALLLTLLTACGGTGSSGPGTGGPDRTITVEEARAAEVGSVLRVRGAVVAAPDGARMCDALAESYPPQCPGGLPLTGFDTSTAGAGPGVDGTSWVESIELVVRRDARGLTVVPSQTS